jgi:hypothetical protein
LAAGSDGFAAMKPRAMTMPQARRFPRLHRAVPSAPFAGCPFPTQWRPIVFLLVLATFLLGQTPLSGRTDGSLDSLQVKGAAAPGFVVHGAVAESGARLPQGAPQTPLFPVGHPVPTILPTTAFPIPLSGKRNLPTDGEYAFLRTRIRTLSPLCRIACG